MILSLCLVAVMFAAPAYLAWRNRREVRAGELQAWYDAGWEGGYQAAISDAIRLIQESDEVRVSRGSTC